MSTLGRLRAMEREWRGEEDRVWAQVVGAVLAVGLFARGATHVWTVLLAREWRGVDVSPELADTDISVASPVEELRGHRLDVVARVATLGVGIGAWAYVAPLTGGSVPVQAFVVANIGVCLLDPLWYGMALVRTAGPDR